MDQLGFRQGLGAGLVSEGEPRGWLHVARRGHGRGACVHGSPSEQ